MATGAWVSNFLIALISTTLVVALTQGPETITPPVQSRLLLAVQQVPVARDPNHIVDPASGHVRLNPRRNRGNNKYMPRLPHEAEVFLVAWVFGCLWLCGYFVRRGWRNGD